MSLSFGGNIFFSLKLIIKYINAINMRVLSVVRCGLKSLTYYR